MENKALTKKILFALSDKSDLPQIYCTSTNHKLLSCDVTEIHSVQDPRRYKHYRAVQCNLCRIRTGTSTYRYFKFSAISANPNRYKHIKVPAGLVSMRKIRSGTSIQPMFGPGMLYVQTYRPCLDQCDFHICHVQVVNQVQDDQPSVQRGPSSTRSYRQGKMESYPENWRRRFRRNLRRDRPRDKGAGGAQAGIRETTKTSFKNGGRGSEKASR